MNSQIAAARAAGLGIVMEGCNPGVRFAYVKTDREFPGTMIEIMELGEQLTAMFREIRAASNGWTGSDPVRRF